MLKKTGYHGDFFKQQQQQQCPVGSKDQFC